MSRAPRRGQEHPKGRRGRILPLLFVAVAVVAAAVAVLGALAWMFLQRPLDLPGSPYDFHVRAGSSLAAVARELAADGVLPHPAVLVALARARGVDRTIKAGSYEVEQGITLPALLAMLTQGDVTQTSITIVEGTTFADLKALLRANPAIAKTVLDRPDGDILAALGAGEPSAEGLFFPDTYFFAAGNSDVAVLKRAYRTLEERLAAAWQKRANDSPLRTPHEALILASIVEKETGRAADRPLVASVFVNRLRAGIRLQSDPTVIYGMAGTFDGNLRRRDLDADTPYNTYTRDGLPPTPIALPSQASLEAVVSPPKTNYLYFVSRGDGTSEFSATLADHNRAVAKYQKGAR